MSRGNKDTEYNEVVVGLDVGSSKITALVCEISETNSLDVIGVGISPSIGIKRGMITDIEASSHAILDAIARAENMSGCSIGSVTVSLAGANIASSNSRGIIAITSQDKEIVREDVERVLEAAKVIAIPPDREVIHVLPKEYIIDGCRGIKRPLGMSGIRLEVETHIVTGTSTAIQNVIKSVNKADLDIEQLVLQPIASGEAVLTVDEKEQGVAVVDIGAGTTSIAVYMEGSIVHTAVIPIGGANITNDIALVLRVPLPIAEDLKLTEGCAISSLVQDSQMCGFVPSDTGRLYRNVEKKKLAEIIEARVLEIFSHVSKEISRFNSEGSLPAGAVLTGGSALLNSIAELAQGELDMPVRIGVTQGVFGMSSIVTTPEFSTVAGLCKLAWDGAKYETRKPSQKSSKTGNKDDKKGTKGRGRSSSDKKPAFSGLKDLFRDMFAP